MTETFEMDLDRYVQAIYGKKVLSLVALDIRGKTSFADAYLICSGRSHRQVSAISEHIRRDLKKSESEAALRGRGKRGAVGHLGLWPCGDSCFFGSGAHLLRSGRVVGRCAQSRNPGHADGKSKTSGKIDDFEMEDFP